LKPIHLYQAWKILPLSAKALMIAGEAVSGIIYWAGTHADPRYGCLTGICSVTRENIQQTIFFGQALIILCSLIFLFALVTIAVTLDKKEEEGKTFEELEKKVETDESPNVSQ
jgi:hypothetical protein